MSTQEMTAYFKKIYKEYRNTLIDFLALLNVEINGCFGKRVIDVFREMVTNYEMAQDQKTVRKKMFLNEVWKYTIRAIMIITLGGIIYLLFTILSFFQKLQGIDFVEALKVLKDITK